jgi:hypothetical protein
MKETPKLMLPVQSAPVDRTLGAAALSGNRGVETSQNAGQVVSSILSALPTIFSLF